MDIAYRDATKAIPRRLARFTAWSVATDAPLTGSFANAHNFIIGNAYIIDNTRTEDENGAEKERRIERGETNGGWKIAAKGMPGAMIDSNERAYTQRVQRGQLPDFMCSDPQLGTKETEPQRFLWLLKPAAAGKSAVA
ncbi:hypothetical protein D9756_002752 [Leucocoprinus leucothites]|uniref:Uncharacterized protein n=1 Tax=Leucocoprinus leucothites TaxID=201217 RepID=A0A8H5GCR7_9AGAR|nr:hypothetical protein D9756_002752 [Leucoagaricus leucothites]